MILSSIANSQVLGKIYTANGRRVHDNVLIHTHALEYFSATHTQKKQ